MNNRKNKSFAILLFSLLLSSSCIKGTSIERKPNIIFILVDDLGYGDLGVYGQKYIQTPVLDKMAAEGISYSQFYSGSPVCAPSRSTLMTGMHTGHTHIRGNKEVQPEGQEPLLDSIITVAEMLKSSGYKTAAFGKWGLGFVDTEGDPINQGFDTFFGYNCQRQSHRYYPDHLWNNNVRVDIPNSSPKNRSGYAPDIIQKQALSFIENNKDEPFFLFLPYTLPHAELVIPDDSLFDKYKGKFDESPFKGNDYVEGQSVTGYSSQDYPKAAYAAMVNRIDVYVGQVLSKLKELGLDENTLVIFTSDNGPSIEGGANPDFFRSSGIYKGYKRDVYEGGIRVPFIAKWKGKIKPGSMSDHISALWDILPTLAEVAGMEIQHNIDGISLLPSMLGKEQSQHKYLYWEFHEQGGKQAVRKDDWKAVRLNVKLKVSSPVELYNLAEDPTETNDIAEKHPEKVKELEALMKEAHVESVIFPFVTK